MIRATAELQFQLSQRNIQAMLRQLQSQLNVPLNINTGTAQRDINAVGDSLRRSTGFATNFGLAVGDSARRFAAYGAGVAIIAKIAFAFKSAASELLKFDKDMTTLSQVTGKTKDNLAAISQEILKLSVRTGISAGKLGELTVTLSQAGLKGKDLSNALDVIAASDLSPSFESMEDSVEGLIAIMQQFKKPSTEFRRQFGFINELSKEFAIESADIIEGVKRAGSVFESAGASLEEFASIMTIVRSTTRESAESIATGLKTITERIQRPEIIDYLEELGVELRDVEGKFVGPLKAFENLSAALSKRGSLSKGSLELIAVAKEIGGGRNLTKIIPILNSAAKAQKILKDASEKAADSLAKDEAAALKSVSKQLDILRADFVKFIHEVSVSDEFKNMAKSALGFAKAMVEVLKATTPFIPLIAQLGVLFGARSIVRGFTGAASPKFSGMRDDLPGLATGGAIDGVVKGPGSGTSDDIYARLSNGEFVIKASSVSKIGRNRLQYLNARGEMPAFARGGSVGGEPVSAFGGITSPLISVAVFAALSKAMTGLKEDTESSSGTFDKFKESILPVIPAGILLYQGFKVTRTQLDLMAKSIKNVNGKVNTFTTWMNDAPRRGYERERTGNLEDAQIANNGAPLSRRQMKLADPTTNRVLAAGGTVGEAAVARRAFGRSLNSRVAGEGGNYELAQRRAREAALTARRDDIVRTPDRLTATRDTQATDIRNSAAAGAPGFAGFTSRQIAAITNNNAAARTGRDRAIGSLQGNVSIDERRVLRAQTRMDAAGTPSVDIMTAQRDALGAQRASPGTTRGQRASLSRQINVLDTQISSKNFYTDLIRARNAQIAATNQSIRSLQALNATEDALAAANTRRATTNVGDNIAEFDRGLQRPPRSLRRALRRGAQDFSAANERFGGAAAGITAAGIAGAAALSSSAIATSRKNAEEAITSGSSGTAYSETLNASREERNQSSIITAGGIGGTIGSIFGPLGTAIGGVTGALIGMTGAVEFITSWFTGIDPEEKSRQEAKDARRASEVNAVNKMMNDGVTKYGDQSRLADSVRISDGPEAAARKRGYQAQARMSLAETATSAVARVKSGDATSTDAMDGYKTLQAQLANEFATLADETLSKGGTFDDVKRKAPELVAALSMLTQEIGDPNLSTALMEQVESIKKGSDLFKKESLLRSVALNELNNAVLYQKRVNASLQALASETRSISMSGDSASLRGQAISGDLSSQPIKEFGISLSEISTQLTADFHETLNAVGSFSQELQSQATAYKNILAASEQFSQDLPKILTDNLDPADIKTSGKKAIRQAYGGLGETKVTDIQKQFESLITDQESSGASADVKSRQINDFIKSINEEVGGALLDDLEKGRSERQARLEAISDTLEKEASLRTAALDKQIEANNALDNFRQEFTKSTSDSVAAARRGRTDRILKTIGGSTTGNDAADFTSLTNSRNAKVEQIDRLNASSKIGVITDEEVKRKAKLVEEVNVLGRALSELTDVSEDVTKAQEALAKLEDKQSKLKGKASELAFGGNDARQGFARSLVAQKFVSGGGNLQDLPEQLRSELFSFLQEFGDAKVFNGQSGTDIINTQTSKFLQSLGYSNDQVASLMTDMQPIEKKQLDALLKIVTNTADKTVEKTLPQPAAIALPQFARGGQPRGVDTIPAMVAPGEFIVSADNAKKNKGLLHSINSGTVYANKGGWVGPDGKLYTESEQESVAAHTKSMNAYYASVATNSPDQQSLQNAELKQRELLRSRGLWNETTNRSVSMTYTPPSKDAKVDYNPAVSSATNEKLIDIRKRGVDSRRELAANRDAEKEKLYLSRGIAGSSSEAAGFARENRNLSSQPSQFDRALDGQSNGYNQLVASMKDRLTPEMKAILAEKGRKHNEGLIKDRTGLGKRFAPGEALDQYYSSGQTFYEKEFQGSKGTTDIGMMGNAAMSKAREQDLAKAAAIKAEDKSKKASYIPSSKDLKKEDIRQQAKAAAKLTKDVAKFKTRSSTQTSALPSPYSSTAIALTYTDSPSKSTKTSKDFTGPKNIRSQQHQDILNIKEQALAGPKFNEAVSSEGNEKLIDIRNRGVDSRRGLAAEREAEKEKLYFSRGIAGSSTEAAQFARENRSLSSGSSQIDRALDTQSNGYNTLLASMEGRITPAEKELLAKKGLKSRAALVTDRTGLSKRFEAGGALEKYYESGKSFSEREREEAYNSTDAGIAGNAAMAQAREQDLIKSAQIKEKDRARKAAYIPTEKDLKREEIRKKGQASGEAARKLAKLGPNAVARNAREQDLAEIRAKKLAAKTATPKYTEDEIKLIQLQRANRKTEYGKILHGDPKGIRAKRAASKKRPVNRLSSADPRENSNPITSNDQVITADMVKAQLMTMVQESNLKSTRSFLKVDESFTDDQFRVLYNEQVSLLGDKYQRVMETLFGSNKGKVDGNEVQSLFSGSRNRNGIFSSGIVNQKFLTDNTQQVREIQQALFELGNAGDTTDTTEQILNRMTKNGFGKSMRNLNVAVTQALTGAKPELTGPVQQAKTEQAVQQAQIPMPVQPAGTNNANAQIEWERMTAQEQQDIINSNAEIDKRNAIMDQENAKKTREMEIFNEQQRNERARRSNQTAAENMNQTAIRNMRPARRPNSLNRPQVPMMLDGFYDGGIVGGKGGRDNNVVRASRGEGIVKTSTMNKIGSKGFEQLNKTGSLPQEELKSSVDMLMKTPTWMADFTSAVKALAGTSIKAELAPVSVNVRINGAEVLASLNADMKNLIKREVVTAVSNMYHDNSGKHMIRGMA